MKPKSTQYTIRCIPPSLDRALRLQAEQEGKSLNQIALEALQRGVGMTGLGQSRRDLSEIAGSWQEDPEFDAIVEAQDQIDQEAWR
jgi:hypothetical protein